LNFRILGFYTAFNKRSQTSFTHPAPHYSVGFLYFSDFEDLIIVASQVQDLGNQPRFYLQISPIEVLSIED